jgi:hypothetical protein
MAAARTLREVNAALEVLNGRRARRVRRSGYGGQTIRPLVKEIRRAGDQESRRGDEGENGRRLGALLDRLGPELYRRMGTEALEAELAAQDVQAGLIGRTAARPTAREVSRGTGEQVSN